MTFSHDKAYLEDCVQKTTTFLAGLKFEMNEKKTTIHPISDGIEFLWFKYFLTETGKVLMFIKSGNVKRERRKLRRLVALSKKGRIPKEKVYESYAAWRNHASKGNSYKLLARMDKYYRDLWRD